MVSPAPVGLSRIQRRLAVLVALLVYLFLGNDGRHHWHEWRHVYSAANYPIAELAAGTFDPGPPPERSAAETGAWYWGQLAHEGLLRGVIGRLGTGPGTLSALDWIYGLAVPLGALFLFLTLRRLPLGVDPLFVTVAALLSPLAVYLGFKLMGETAALPFAVSTGYLFVSGLLARSAAKEAVLLALASVSLVICFLFKVFMPVLFVGFSLALPIAFREKEGYGWGRVLSRLGIVLGVAMATASALGAVVGVELGEWARIYVFFRDYRQPMAASLFGVLTAGSLLYVTAPFAALTRERRSLVFFLAWTALTALPIGVLAVNFVEARYLSVALIPFPGLAALGLQAIAASLRGGPRGSAAAMALVIVVHGAATVIALPFLPYEMSSRQLTAAVETVWRENPRAAILVPWNYTDYHFLKVAFPERPVYLVQAAVDESGRVCRDERWERRQARNYGPAFIAGAGELRRVEEAEWIYIGNGVLPPIRNLRELASRLHLEPVVRRLDALQPRNHTTESWLWRNPGFRLTETLRVGQYEVYRVMPRAAPARPKSACPARDGSPGV